MAPDGDLIGPGEAAEILGIGRATLYRWTQAGKLRYWELGPYRRRRFARRDIEKLLQERQAGADPANEGGER